MAGQMKLPRSTPEAQGVSSKAILTFLDEVEREVPEFHSLMVLRNGAVIAEGWWAPYGPKRVHMLYSLSKSFTSTAVGIAVDEGRLSVEDKVLGFFPDEAPARPDANLKRMRVKHLLSMATGHDTDPTWTVFSQHNWVQSFLSLPVEHEPGTHFVYNTAATYMLSAIVQKLTGEKLTDYLKPRLFEPLGITGARWDTCPLGINVGGSGLRVKTEAIARFGQLYLDKGVFNGQRLVSEKWVKAASSKQVDNGPDPNNDWNQGYGYQFWRCRHNCYRGDGACGQYCIVMPEQNAVVAITSGVADMQAVLNKVWDHLLPGFAAKPLAEDVASEALTERLASLRYEPPKGKKTYAIAAKVSGRTAKFEPNNWQLTSARLDFDEGGAKLTLAAGRREQYVECGLEEWRPGRTALLSHRPEQVVASGTWTALDTFEITMRQVEMPAKWTITCKCSGKGLTVSAKAHANFGPSELPELVGEFE